MRKPLHPLSKTRSDTLGWVIKGNVSGNPSRDQMFSWGWDRDITVMMVMQIVVLVVVLEDIAMRTTRFQVPTTLEGLPVWMIDERVPGCVDEDLAKNNRSPMRKRVGIVRESLSEATPGRPVDWTLVMMMNGWIEIARIGGVRATEAVPLASTPRVGTLLPVDHHLKTRKTKTGRSCHAPPLCPPVGERGETAFQKREPSHHTPMQGLRRPLGEKERKNRPSKHPASVSLDLLTRLAAVLVRMDAAA